MDALTAKALRYIVRALDHLVARSPHVAAEAASIQLEKREALKKEAGQLDYDLRGVVREIEDLNQL